MLRVDIEKLPEEMGYRRGFTVYEPRMLRIAC